MINIDYLYDTNVAKKFFDKDNFVDKELGYITVEKGTILPHKSNRLGGLKGAFGGIVNRRRQYLKNSFVTHSRIDRSYPLLPESIEHSSETVIYLGMFYPVWGHVITDNLRRLWFLKSDVYKKHFKNCPLVYIPWEKSREPTDKNFKRLLEILEINPDSWQPVTKPTQFDKIILPDENFYNVGGRKFTQNYREMIDHVRDFALKNRTPTSIKKIYYFYGKHQFGEERLAEYFKSKGYTIVSPEKLTFDEQLNLLINAESFASTLGSCSHNSVFLRDGVEAIFIPRAAAVFTSYQQAINSIHPVIANYVDSALSAFYSRSGPYCFIISEQLKRFFGDKFNGYAEEDFKIFLQYVKRWMIGGLSVNPRAKEYYATIFPDFLAQLKRRKDLIDAFDMPPAWDENLL